MNFYMVHNKRDIPEDLGDKADCYFGHSHKYLEKSGTGVSGLIRSATTEKRASAGYITMAVYLTVQEDSWHVERIDIPHEAVPDTKAQGGRAGRKEHR